MFWRRCVHIRVRETIPLFGLISKSGIRISVLESSQSDAPVEIRIGRKIFVLTIEQAEEIVHGISAVINKLNKESKLEKK